MWLDLGKGLSPLLTPKIQTKSFDGRTVEEGEAVVENKAPAKVGDLCCVHGSLPAEHCDSRVLPHHLLNPTLHQREADKDLVLKEVTGPG